MKQDHMGKKGIVFNIQRYSIHDGPGIRTTVFLKGCPLRCKWCSNPESINPHIEIFIRANKCTHCGKCIDVCSARAISVVDDSIQIDWVKCDLCMKCINVCPSEVLDQVGEWKTVEQVVEELIKDEMFYNNSGGGVTISGGEPLYQAKFTLNILRECKAKALNTALDTTGHAKWKDIEEILNYTDVVLFDVKSLDRELHEKYTGVSNELILKNFEKILEKGLRVWVRIPLIPDFNSSKQNIEELANFLSGKPIEKVSLLNYHEWGKHKYKYLCREYPLDEVTPISDENLHNLKSILESYGLNVTLNY